MSTIPVSYHMGKCKWVEKTVARAVKLSKEALGNSMCHFAAGPVSARWKRRSQTDSSFREFDEYHK